MTITPTQVSEVKLIYKRRVPSNARFQVEASFDAEEVLRANWDDNMDFTESFYILCLDRNSRVLAMPLISSGGMAGTVVDAKVIFTYAIKLRAQSLILAHNHPSGTLSPSVADLKVTQDCKVAGEALGIPIVDHLILTSESYYSFADNGDL